MLNPYIKLNPCQATCSTYVYSEHINMISTHLRWCANYFLKVKLRERSLFHFTYILFTWRRCHYVINVVLTFKKDFNQSFSFHIWNALGLLSEFVPLIMMDFILFLYETIFVAWFCISFANLVIIRQNKAEMLKSVLHFIRCIS